MLSLWAKNFGLTKVFAIGSGHTTVDAAWKMKSSTYPGFGLSGLEQKLFEAKVRKSKNFPATAKPKKLRQNVYMRRVMGRKARKSQPMLLPVEKKYIFFYPPDQTHFSLALRTKICSKSYTSKGLGQNFSKTYPRVESHLPLAARTKNSSKSYTLKGEGENFFFTDPRPETHLPLAARTKSRLKTYTSKGHGKPEKFSHVNFR